MINAAPRAPYLKKLSLSGSSPPIGRPRLSPVFLLPKLISKPIPNGFDSFFESASVGLRASGVLFGAFSLCFDSLSDFFLEPSSPKNFPNPFGAFSLNQLMYLLTIGCTRPSSKYFSD